MLHRQEGSGKCHADTAKGLCMVSRFSVTVMCYLDSALSQTDPLGGNTPCQSGSWQQPNNQHAALLSDQHDSVRDPFCMILRSAVHMLLPQLSTGNKEFSTSPNLTIGIHIRLSHKNPQIHQQPFKNSRSSNKRFCCSGKLTMKGHANI